MQRFLYICGKESVNVCLISMLCLGERGVERPMRHPQSMIKMSTCTNPCAGPRNYTPPAGLVNSERDKANTASSHPNSIKLRENTIKQ